MRLMRQVRVPVLSIEKCIRAFSDRRMAYFDVPLRPPTPREAAVEQMLAFLENPPPAGSDDWDAMSLSYIGVNFTARDIQTIREMIEADPSVPLGVLAERVCRRFQVSDSHGRARRGTMADILRRMAMDNVVSLSQKSPGTRNKSKTPPRVSEPAQEVGGVASRRGMYLSLALVRSPEESLLWNGVIHHYHYIPGYRLFGRRLRYLVHVAENPSALEDPCARVLVAALSFSCAAWRVACRDDYIGWSDAERVANLSRVVSNSRFLILPWIRVTHLASRILGAAARQVPGDWESRYGCRPVLFETFVERGRFHGTCYKAANWVEVGHTTGYSLCGFKAKKSQPARSVFLMPLHRKFRDILCR